MTLITQLQVIDNYVYRFYKQFFKTVYDQLIHFQSKQRFNHRLSYCIPGQFT